MNVTALIVFVIFLGIIFFVGLLSGKGGGKTEEEYYTGGRSFGALPTAISAGATNGSGWLFIGACGWSYTVGAASMWMLPGFVLGFIIENALIAPRLRYQSNKLGAMSVSDFLAKKLDDQWKTINTAVRLVAALILVFFFLPYMSTQLMAAGKTMQVVTGINYTLGLVLSAVFVTAYCFVGGYKSVIYTDMLQGLLMAFILLFIPMYFILIRFGGWHSFWKTINDIDPLMLTSAYGAKGGALISFALGWVLYGVGNIGQPHISQRYITARNDKTLKGVAYISLGWMIIAMTGSNLLGLCGRIILPNLSDPEYVFPAIVAQQLNPVIIGLVVGAIASAIMSTFSSQLMVAVQSIASDILNSMSKKVYTEKQKVLISRFIMLLCSFLATLIALMNLDSVFALVNYAWSGIAASFAPLMILLLTRPCLVNKEGAIASLIIGPTITTIWYILGLNSKIHEIAPGMISAAIVCILISKAFDKKYQSS